MLDGLDAIDWSTVSHAYGPATDVPDLLRDIAGPDQSARDRALRTLSGSIYHQGTVYRATALAIPFLASIATEAVMPPRDRTMIVALLAAIAAGSSYLEMHRGLLHAESTAEDHAAMARQIDDVVAARAAVGSEAPALFARLGGVDPQTDWRLAALAAQVPEFADSAMPLVGTLMGLSDDARLDAALALTIALIDGAATPAVVDVAAAAIDPEERDEVEDLCRLAPDRRGRLVAEYLFEFGFDETHVGG